MRKVIFTEEQLRRIIGEDVNGFVLDVSDGSEAPDNAYGTQVFSDYPDKDVETDVTTTDNFSRKKNRVNRLFARSRTYESINESNFDDAVGQNFGKNEKETIMAQGNSENSGKMLKNISNDIANGGTRNNTNQVRISRLKQQKKDDPAMFARNGGDKTLKALKSATRKVSTTNSTAQTDRNANPLTITPDAGNGTGNGHHNDNVIYYY